MQTIPQPISSAQTGQALTPAGLAQWASQSYADLFRLSFSILDNPSEAEDAVQETLIAAHRALASFRGEASPRTWLFAIAINICRAQLRRRRSRRALDLTLAAIQRLRGHTPGPEERLLVQERSSELLAAVRRLDEKHRLPVILRYVNDLPVAEIAALLQVNEGTVHSRLHYARRKLLELLEPAGGDL